MLLCWLHQLIIPKQCANPSPSSSFFSYLNYIYYKQKPYILTDTPATLLWDVNLHSLNSRSHLGVRGQFYVLRTLVGASIPHISSYAIGHTVTWLFHIIIKHLHVNTFKWNLANKMRCTRVTARWCRDVWPRLLALSLHAALTRLWQ